MGKILSFLFIVPMLFSCKENNPESTFTLFGKSTLLIIQKIEDKKLTSMVFGQLIFQNFDPKLKAINLECIVIEVNGVRSGKLYVDSIASVLASQYLLNQAKSNPSVNVYWEMSDFVDNDLDNIQFNLVDVCAQKQPKIKPLTNPD